MSTEESEIFPEIDEDEIDQIRENSMLDNMNEQTSFIEVFLFGGVVKSFGILFVEYSKELQASSSSVSLILSIQSIMGGIVGLLVMTVWPLFFSHRCLTIFGGFMLSAGYLVNSVAPNISVVMVGTGVLYGMGGSFTHGPATVMIGKYFDKRLGFVNGFFKVGGGLGSFAFPFIFRALLDIYDLQGTLLIISGLLLNVVPCGALLRPIEFYSKKRNNSNTYLYYEEKEDLLNYKSQQGDSKKHMLNIQQTTVTKHNLFPFASTGNISRNQNSGIRERTFTNTDSMLDNRKQILKPQVSSFSSNNIGVYGSIDYIGSIQSINSNGNSIIQNQGSVGDNVEKPNVKKICRTIFNKTLIKNRLFLMFLISTTLSITGICFINNFIPPHAKDIGIGEHKSALLLSIFGATDLLGRLMMACIADHFTKRYRFFAVSMLTAGVMCLLISLMTTFWSLVIFSAMTGFCTGFYAAVVIVVLIDFVGINHLGSGYGIHQLAICIALTAYTPVLGVIRDSTGSYAGSFYLMGGSLVAAGILLLFEPLVRKHQERLDMFEKSITVECTT